MDNLPIKAKEKKLNIIQKIRLAMFRNQKFSIDKYIKAPEYIKTDNRLINKIIYSKEICTEENLLQIPGYKLEELIRRGNIKLDIFSSEKQIEFIKKSPDIMIMYSDEKVFGIVDKAIKNGRYDFLCVVDRNMQGNYLRYLKENEALNRDLPNILKYLDNDIIYKLVEKKNDLVIYLDEEQQMKIAQKNEKCFKYINSDIQLKYIQQDPKYIDLASDEAQEKFTLLDKSNFQRTTQDFQLKTIVENPNAYQYSSEEVKYEIWNDSKNEIARDAAISMLKKDIRNSKHLELTDNLGYEIIDKYIKLFENVQNEDIQTIKRYFLHSKMFDAKGKLLPSDKALHGNSPEKSKGIDDYTYSQIEVIHKLNSNQIRQLVDIDSNYVLPYLAGNGVKRGEDRENFHMIDEENIEHSKEKCEELFNNMFGEEKLEDIKECFNIIYDLQQKKYEYLKDATYNGNIKGVENNDQIAKMREIEDVPLDQVKILFNRDIIEKNSTEVIKRYFEKYNLGQDNSAEFKELLENAYGSHVKGILDSRAGVDVHSINSLEVFDKRIIDNFGEAFVHDLISYNIRDFSAFLEVIKDEDKLSNFKTYYNVLTNVMGNNVETMQRAFSEYRYNEELLENVKDIEITDTQYDNLISVLCSRNNMYDINTLQQLQNFDEIANEITRKELETTRKMQDKGKQAEKIKQIISEHILGLDYTHNYKTRNYGDSFEYLRNMYDISSEDKNKEVYKNSEITMLEVMNFIDKEMQPEKLLDVANSLMNEKGIRNPIAIYNAIDKMKEQQMDMLNESFLTIDKMEQACKEEEGKENPKITKSMREDGIIQYSLEGIDFTFLQHATSGFSLQDILTYEGQLGNNAICTRIIHNKNRDVLKEALGYTNVEKNGIIAYSRKDANTNHMPKLVRGTANIDGINITQRINNKGNEVAINRRIRNHENISNDNLGGKILPDVLITNEEKHYLDPETLKFLKQHNIPVVYINGEKYKDMEKNQEQNKEKMEEIDNVDEER